MAIELGSLIGALTKRIVQGHTARELKNYNKKGAQLFTEQSDEYKGFRHNTREALKAHAAIYSLRNVTVAEMIANGLPDSLKNLTFAHNAYPFLSDSRSLNSEVAVYPDLLIDPLGPSTAEGFGRSIARFNATMRLDSSLPIIPRFADLLDVAIQYEQQTGQPFIPLDVDIVLADYINNFAVHGSHELSAICYSEAEFDTPPQIPVVHQYNYGYPRKLLPFIVPIPHSSK